MFTSTPLLGGVGGIGQMPSLSSLLGSSRPSSGQSVSSSSESTHSIAETTTQAPRTTTTSSAPATTQAAVATPTPAATAATTAAAASSSSIQLSDLQNILSGIACKDLDWLMKFILLLNFVRQFIKYFLID